MTGYTAVTRIGRAQMRLAFAACAPAAARPSPEPLPRWIDLEPVDTVAELDGEPLGTRLRERWNDVAVAWRQTTFYLFDPESWR